MTLVIKDLKMFVSRNTIHLRMFFQRLSIHACLILKVMQVSSIMLPSGYRDKSSDN